MQARAVGQNLTRREFLAMSAGTSAGLLMLAAGCGVVDVESGGGGDYPNEAINFIIPFNAGSAPDSTYRKLSEIAEQEIGQSIVILNRPGAQGTIGTTEIIDAEPDGYTIGMDPMATLVLAPELRDTTYEGPDDLQPIIQANIVASVLFVRADSTMETIDDFINRAKEEPGALTVGLPGLHNVFDFQLDVLQREADIEVEKVAFGPGQQITPVVNGTAEAGMVQPAPAMQYVEKGDLRFLGVFGTEKPEGIEAPLFVDEGYDVTAQSYEFVVAPKDTPAERVQIIHDVYQGAIESEEFRDYIRETQGIAQYVGTEELEEKLAADNQFYDELIREFGWV